MVTSNFLVMKLNLRVNVDFFYYIFTSKTQSTFIERCFMDLVMFHRSVGRVNLLHTFGSYWIYIM